MKVGVIGTGYVGLVSGTCFAEMGNSVICVDIDERKVQKLSNGELTIFEPGLEVFFERSLQLLGMKAMSLSVMGVPDGAIHTAERLTSLLPSPKALPNGMFSKRHRR